MKQRDRAIECMQNEIAVFERSIEILRKVPLKVPLLITYNGWKWRGKCLYVEVLCAVIPFALNKSSFRCKLIAVEKDDVSPFINNHQYVTGTGMYVDREQIALKFRDILKWEKLNLGDLPLLAGYKKLYPLYAELMKHATMDKESHTFFKLNKAKVKHIKV